MNDVIVYADDNSVITMPVHGLSRFEEGVTQTALDWLLPKK